MEKSEADSVDDEDKNDAQTEAETNGRTAAAVPARVDPEPGPRQRHQQERSPVHLGREEVHLGAERRRQLLARVRPCNHTLIHTYIYTYN